jgi:hypothetical protein
MSAPALDDDLRLAESVEDLAVEQLVPEPGAREGLAIEVDGRIRSGRVIEVLARLVRGAPLYLRSDNGPRSCHGRCSPGLRRRASTQR